MFIIVQGRIFLILPLEFLAVKATFNYCNNVCVLTIIAKKHTYLHTKILKNNRHL